MQEIQLLRLDNVIGDFAQVFMTRNSNSKFMQLLEKHNFKLADEIDWNEAIKVDFYYNRELNIGINSLFRNGIIVAFSIIHFW